MKRYMFAAAFLLATASWTIAQVPAVPGGLPAAPGGLPAAEAAAAGNQVTVTNKCCSIWDFLGVQQVGKLVGGAFRTRLGQAISNFLSPLGRVLGLGPSLLSDKFAQEGGAMGLANQLKKEEKKVPLKVQAIRYLATLDCHCYPEIVDALLASLDDCAEVVRYEALKALRKQCEGPKHCKDGSCGVGDVGCVDVCTSCQCQKKVVDRLNELLLARDESGCLKEGSERIRALATQMIEECLSCRQPPPLDSQAPAIPPADPVPTPIADPVPTTKSERSYIPTWFKWKEPQIQSMTSAPVRTKPVDGDAFELAPRKEAAPTVSKPVGHTAYYRAEAPVRMEAPKTVAAKPVADSQRYTAQPPVKHASKLIIPAQAASHSSTDSSHSAGRPEAVYYSTKPAATIATPKSAPVAAPQIQVVESRPLKVTTVAKSEPTLKPSTTKPVELRTAKQHPVVIEAKPGRYNGPKQRHIVGELFGY